MDGLSKETLWYILVLCSGIVLLIFTIGHMTDFCDDSDNENLEVHNYYGPVDECVRGCEMAFRKIADDDNSIGMGGFMVYDCRDYCIGKKGD